MPETDESASQFVISGDTRLAGLRDALTAAEERFAGDPGRSRTPGMAIAHAYTDLADAGEHDALPRAQALILGLGFAVGELDNPVNSFSGGWRMRLQTGARTDVSQVICCCSMSRPIIWIWMRWSGSKPGSKAMKAR